MTPKFSEEKCTSIVGHYAKTLEEIRAWEKNSRDRTEDEQAAIIALTGPRLGPADARVTLVAFLDYQDPYVGRHVPLLLELKERSIPDLQIVVRQFPLAFHKHAREAAAAGLAAHAQGKYWNFLARLPIGPKLSEDNLRTAAKDASLDMSKFEADLRSDAVARLVEQEVSLANTAMVPGVPVVYVNGKRVSNPLRIEDLEAAIGAARASGS